MTWIVRNIHRLMIVSGALTLTMLYAAIAPDAALESTFGDTLEGPAADVVVRNWGALIGSIGGMLIYAASRPSVWSLALTIAGASRAIFVGLVMSHGTRFFDHQSGIAVIVDAAWVVVFAVYLFAACRAAPGAATGAPLGTA
jgi:hypothetical protein